VGARVSIGLLLPHWRLVVSAISAFDLWRKQLVERLQEPERKIGVAKSWLRPLHWACRQLPHSLALQMGLPGICLGMTLSTPLEVCQIRRIPFRRLLAEGTNVAVLLGLGVRKALG
jgi:hypothetical protein